jgi:hypothetical protein
MAEIIGALNVSNALSPQDVEVTPGTEDIVIEPAEGCYLRSVTIKAIPADSVEPDVPDEPDNPDTPDTPTEPDDTNDGND